MSIIQAAYFPLMPGLPQGPRVISSPSNAAVAQVAEALPANVRRLPPPSRPLPLRADSTLKCDICEWALDGEVNVWESRPGEFTYSGKVRAACSNPFCESHVLRQHERVLIRGEEDDEEIPASGVFAVVDPPGDDTDDP